MNAIPPARVGHDPDLGHFHITTSPEVSNAFLMFGLDDPLEIQEHGQEIFLVARTFGPALERTPFCSVGTEVPSLE
jgi:hypothetical protein